MNMSLPLSTMRVSVVMRMSMAAIRLEKKVYFINIYIFYLDFHSFSKEAVLELLSE